MKIDALLGDKLKDGMTAEEKLALLENLNLADLSSGNYVDKNKFDAKDSEIAKLKETINSYQKKEFESLNDTQKRDVEYQQLAKNNKELQDLLAEYKLKDIIRASGFSDDECKKIIDATKAGKDLAPIYAEIAKARVQEAVASTKAELIKKQTPGAPSGGKGSDKGGDGEQDEAVEYAKRLAGNTQPQMSKEYANEYYIGDTKPNN